MIIKTINPIAIRVPLLQPIKMGGFLYENSENLIVRIELENGFVGWGEASSAPTMTGETIASMIAAIKYLTPHLQGKDASLFSGNMSLIDRLMYGNSSAKAAFEIACFDAVGKSQKRSMSDLLGGTKRKRLPVLWMLASGKFEADCNEAQQKAENGFRSFKIKVGSGEVSNDIERAKKIREILGSSVQISADANQAWDIESAIQFTKNIGDCLDFIEQPINGSNLTGMAEISKISSSPIGADEGIHSLSDIYLHKEKTAAAGGSLKMIKLGGVVKAQKAAKVSTSLDMKVNLAGKICETSISSAAVTHLAASVPAIEWGLSVTNQYAASDIVKNPIKIIEGSITVPSGYGLGIEVDETLLNQHIIN